jgi:hypothetical protein
LLFKKQLLFFIVLFSFAFFLLFFKKVEMGILKLGSIYKKKNKKDKATPPPTPATPTPKLEPISLDLNLDLHSSNLDTNTFVAPPPPQQKNNTAPPAGPGSLFDDIFAELGSPKEQGSIIILKPI